MPDFDEAPDPTVVRAALARFLSLPISQRCAVIGEMQRAVWLLRRLARPTC